MVFVVPVTGLSWMSAGCSPRPSRTCRSSALKQVLSVAPVNQRWSGGLELSRIVDGGVIHSICSAASRQKASGSSRDCAYAAG